MNFTVNYISMFFLTPGGSYSNFQTEHTFTPLGLFIGMFPDPDSFFCFIIFLMRGQGVWIWLVSSEIVYMYLQHLYAVCKINKGKKNLFLAHWENGGKWVGRLCFSYQNATFFCSAEIKINSTSRHKHML